jgi:hypothetical protein
MPMLAPKFIEMIKNAPNYDPEKYADNIRALEAPASYYIVMGVLAVASLFGAIQMWKLKKAGIYLYIAANVVMAVTPMLLADMPISYFAIIITIGFIAMYSMNFKHLK